MIEDNCFKSLTKERHMEFRIEFLSKEVKIYLFFERESFAKERFARLKRMGLSVILDNVLGEDAELVPRITLTMRKPKKKPKK